MRIDTTTNAERRILPARSRRGALLFLPARSEGQKWADHGIPSRRPSCARAYRAGQIAYPNRGGRDGGGEVSIYGRTNIPDFDHYIVEYGEGNAPIGWGRWPARSIHRGRRPAGRVDVRALFNRDYTLRIVVFDRQGHSAEARTWVYVYNIPPTDTPWPTVTPMADGHPDANRHAMAHRYSVANRHADANRDTDATAD